MGNSVFKGECLMLERFWMWFKSKDEKTCSNIYFGLWMGFFTSVVGSFLGYLGVIIFGLLGSVGSYFAGGKLGLPSSLIASAITILLILLLKTFGLIALEIPVALLVSYLAVTSIKKILRTRARRKAQKETKALEAQRLEVTQSIEKITRGREMAQSFIQAIDLLTKYVPDLGLRILEAVEADARKYAMLETLIASSDNEVAKHRAEGEKAAIAQDIRRICEELSTEALEVIRVAQEDEADALINSSNESRVGEVRRDITRYLEGLREVRESLSPQAKTGEITELRPPERKSIGR